jgi:flagellar biogenesis protein FliO
VLSGSRFPAVELRRLDQLQRQQESVMFIGGGILVLIIVIILIIWLVRR